MECKFAVNDSVNYSGYSAHLGGFLRDWEAILPRDAMLGIRCGPVFVCPSVRASDTSRYCIKMAKRSTQTTARIPRGCCFL